MKHPEYMHDRAVHLYQKGYTDKWISQRLGIHCRTIRYWLKERGVYVRPSPAGRLPMYDYDTIQYMYKEGYRDVEIAEQTGIPPQTVAHWRRKQNLPANNPPLNVISRRIAFEMEIPDEEKPWHDPESLFCDGEFLKNITGKEPLKMGVGK